MLGLILESVNQYLIAHGCDKIQGYLIGRPRYEDAAVEVLNNQLYTCRPLKWQIIINGEIIGVVITFMDISDRKQKERKFSV